jgi:hypothetical protein
MHGYREVFRPDPAAGYRDPGKIFYTITAEDAGKIILHTTACDISLAGWFGIVQPGDAGRRLYRVPGNGGIDGQPVTWIWQDETVRQRDARIARQGSRDGWATQGTAPEFRPGRGTGMS